MKSIQKIKRLVCRSIPISNAIIHSAYANSGSNETAKQKNDGVDWSGILAVSHCRICNSGNGQFGTQTVHQVQS